MYKKILVPIDMAHTEKAKDMIAVARKLAGEGTEYLLVNIVHAVPTAAEMAIPKQVLETAQEEARKVLTKIAGEEGIEAKVVVRIGHAVHDILTIANDNSVDVIIVGSHRPGLQDYLIGSTAARVVRHAQCPVFVLR